MRSRGGPSHRAKIDAEALAKSAPKLLRPALTEIGGWERLQRFAAATAYPTLTIAAEQLGARALVVQKLRLEADLGVQLFHRAQRGQPMRLTERRTASTRCGDHAGEKPASGPDPDPPPASLPKKTRPPERIVAGRTVNSWSA